MWLVIIAATLTSTPNALTAVFLTVALLTTTLHVLNRASKPVVTFLCGLTFLAACASYFEPLAPVLGLKLPSALARLEWGAFVSTHSMRSPRSVR